MVWLGTKILRGHFAYDTKFEASISEQGAGLSFPFTFTESLHLLMSARHDIAGRHYAARRTPRELKPTIYIPSSFNPYPSTPLLHISTPPLHSEPHIHNLDRHTLSSDSA